MEVNMEVNISEVVLEASQKACSRWIQVESLICINKPRKEINTLRAKTTHLKGHTFLASREKFLPKYLLPKFPIS